MIAQSPVVEPGQRIAVVGAGIAGLASAYLLARRHRVTLFEAADYLGGHTHSVDVELEGMRHPVDTGFLVFNDRTYPNLIALFDELGVPAHTSAMSFSVSVDGGRLEWAGSNLNTVFAQRRNLFSPSFLGMLRDILRFNARAHAHLEAAQRQRLCVGELLSAQGYGTPFQRHYLLPMAAAIWSSAANDILRFPAATFLRFCLNHALLQVNDRPPWRTVAGGARRYVERIAATLDDVRVATPVRAIRREAGAVSVATDAAGEERFDAVVLACHAPTSLQLLADASDAERDVLGAVRYQPNVAVLHTDTALLPRRRRVWSAWNYLSRRTADAAEGESPVCVSYLINQLQPLPFSTPVIVTLNPVADPAPGTELGRYRYEHPLLDLAAVDAQQRLPMLQGRGRTWFAGAWTGYGFHEDGLKSALRVAADFGVEPAWATR
ncbi:NAD(P)/FAD-dependent oxidoreductase [Burkholderia glumae]|uniref:FAD-dependent oxidoreductase n=2 Tax=Burkholderia glumae TaxID=337 RepID=A0AAP9XXT1_BURGL|nr:FAD-dependent oxidoreductase [Burkholderia glumae]ACR31319.1 FAD dependent oxidoreductase [Burkholderia glumae BGR1]AJY63809.1 FAD dependent oxidoreductase family protein [Burkholderia glumae LMG 2196 = ATCC 33617]KHJ63098.1 NADH-ubiquinone oxidoreductase subunit 6 [Burkholderia glumae]MCM2485526.1 FAD-dependent oxidoreductase [Burkholderia glumae]MCM2495933.1 FAD-dependent oxidoreductase [Burkholderia glumae]